MSDNIANENSSTFKAKPSATLLAAKREAFERNKSLKKKENNTIFQDIYQKAFDTMSLTRKRTGLVYDYLMTEHKCLWDLKYPESPERLVRVIERCKELKLIDRCSKIKPRYAEYEELLLKHSSAHIELLKSTKDCHNLEKLENFATKYDAIYFHPSTFQLSLLAVGSAINLVENICKGDVQNGMAIIRPPGHHALSTEYCGYCFFNNVAIAAEVILKNKLAKKILIIDWDVHHGQATQQMFYNDPRVVYFSIHRYENGEFWPNLKESNFHYIGEGPGTGYNFNIPLNKIGMTNADYLAIFQQVLLPMAYEFQPDLIIVSAGYDAALGCPEGLMNITPACYSHLLFSLMCLASGKVAVILEGGYCLKSLAESAALTLRTLLGDPCPMIQDLTLPCDSVQETILNVIYTHRLFWKCFQYQESFNIHDEWIDEKTKRHFPLVTYKGPATVPTIYETRNCYPTQTKEELQIINRELDFLIQNTNLIKAPIKVSIAYDKRMLKHYNAINELHPEKPERITSIISKFEEFGLLDRCFILQGRKANYEELLLAHSEKYIETIKKTSDEQLTDLKDQASRYNSIYLNTSTWESSIVSTGSLLQLVDSVLSGESQSGIAIVRPPGHHAEEDQACGFCIFNNIAIAARYAVRRHQLKRVLVVDWDIHHGNGTQSILYNDSSILYVSLHRYDHGSFFPNSKLADFTEVGSGSAAGYNINIPWNEKGLGDAEYIAAFQQIIMPIAYQYNPELVLVSAGFDACIADPLGGFKVSPELYGHMTHWLSALANGKIILSLEGGYNVHSTSYAMTMCTKSLLGDPLVQPKNNLVPCSSAIKTIKNVLSIQNKYWPNLVFQKSLPQQNVMPTAKVSFRCNNFDDSIETLHSHPQNFLEQRNKSITPNSVSEQLCKAINSINIKERIEKCSKASKSENYSNASTLNTTYSSVFDFLQDNFKVHVKEEFFTTDPLIDCLHLKSIKKLPENSLDFRDTCAKCGCTFGNWICLECYSVHCARNINQHALQHNQLTGHPLVLNLNDISVWCYICEAFIDNPRLYLAQNAIYNSKFNTDLLWTFSRE